VSPGAEFESTLLWALAALVALAVVAPYAWSFRRRRRADRARLAEARALGLDRPVAQFPFVDPAHCIGCGACVKACPEGDVLGVVGGVAVVINGLRCVGHGRCADACPVGAIEIGLGDLKGRRDVPILTDELETSVPGLFVAGELSGLALIRNAVQQGGAVIDTIAGRLRGAPPAPAGTLDVLVVGAGPAGLAAALAARLRGLAVGVIDQSAGLGGTILHFPSRKMVLTRPVELPGGCALSREEYTKEEVLELLGKEIAERGLRVRHGEKLLAVERAGELFEVRSSAGLQRARHVVLALGRRGSPRQLGVPGEDRAKVMYQLRDAESYQRQDLLVVGGGDSAVEAAIGLARQPGNRVTVSYRKDAFYRTKRKNQEVIETMLERGRVRAVFESEVESIGEREVVLRTPAGTETLANDYVFVLIGGEPPYDLLRGMGVRFGGDGAAQPPARRPQAPAAAALALAFAFALLPGASAPLAAQDSPHGDLAIACDQCHSTADWRVGRDIPFRHESTGFRLEGAHAVAACAQCHTSKVFSRVGSACADCHRDAHEGELGLACASCHDTRRWDVRTELFSAHSRTLFPLLAAHARVDCEACHGGQAPNQFSSTPTDCYSCHRADYAAATSPPHQGFPRDCEQCHSSFMEDWRAPGFRHPDRFPLTGAHAGLSCEQCHAGGYTGASADCYSCHRADYQAARDPNHVAGRLPTTCQVCHSTSSWQPASFDHALTGFPLEGAHRAVACEQCHSSGYQGTPADCVSCHRADYDAARDPNHRSAGFPTTCQTCHTMTAWRPASFDHSRTRFPLTGAHASEPCSSCHQSGYTGTPTQCYACHADDYRATRDPNHAAAGFPTTCESCHNTRSWDDANFDHDGLYFPIYSGAHRGRWTSCSNCHVSPSNYRQFECILCHEHNRQDTDDHHRGVSNYRYESQACFTCHPDGRGD